MSLNLRSSLAIAAVILAGAFLRQSNPSEKPEERTESAKIGNAETAIENEDAEPKAAAAAGISLRGNPSVSRAIASTPEKTGLPEPSKDFDEANAREHMSQWRYVRGEWSKVRDEFCKNLSKQTMDRVNKALDAQDESYEKLPQDLSSEQLFKADDEIRARFNEQLKLALGPELYSKLAQTRDQFNEDIRGETRDQISIDYFW